MPLLHSCKTRTHKECVLQSKEDIELIRHVQSLAQRMRVEDAYRKLLEKEPNLRLHVPNEDIVLPLKRNLFGLYMIPLEIGYKTYWFILDTGAQISGIREHVLDTLHLLKLKGKLPVGSVGGMNKDMDGYLIPHLAMKGVHVYDLPVIGIQQEFFSLRFGDIDFLAFDGILGWDILSRLDFEIDDVAKEFKIIKNRFRFTYENALPAAFPILFVKDQNQHLCTMGIDTGAKVSWLNEEVSKKLGYPIGESKQMLGYGVHGMESMDVKLIEQCDFYLYKAHIRIKNIHTGRTNVFPNLTINGILGNEIFRNRRIRFVNSKHIVLLA